MTDISDNDKICDVHLYAELNQLKEALAENNSQLMAMEAARLQESDRQVELEDSLIAWQDKYERLHESHKRVQKINQILEDKLLKLVDRNAGERAQLTSDVATLSVRLAQANYNIGTLQREIERYKADMGLAIQLLQCKPENFVSQKVASLPQEIQNKVAQYVRLDTNSHSDSEGSTSGVGMATENAYHILPASDSPISSCPFSSAPLVYRNSSSSANGPNVNNGNDERMISPLGMAKYLEDKLKAADVKHCETCMCANQDLRVLADIDQTYSVGTQTILQGEINSALCLRCNVNLNSPSSTNSPYLMKLVKSSDSSISETKSSVSCADSNDKFLGKKEELMVNPILGHNSISDRKKSTTKSSDSIKNEAHVKLRSPTIETPKTSITEKQLLSRTTTSSSNNLSSRTSVSGNLDGSKLFESFNRNLIKSIKAEKPNLSGPRLCALRIPNGSTNILLDNIESESTPVVYTRRSRFLDEELDETKDVITTYSYSLNDCNEEQQTRKISMLMTDGVISEPDIMRTEHKSSFNQYQDDGTGQNTTNRLIGNNDDLINQQLCANSMHKIVNVNTFELNGPLNGCIDQDLQSDNVYVTERTDDMTTNQSALVHTIEMEVPTNAQLQQQMQHDEVTLLRRQQLNRVAEWIQNSSHVEPIPSYATSVDTLPLDFKSKFSNSIDLNNCLVDRKLRAIVTCNSIYNNNANISQMIASSNGFAQEVALNDSIINMTSRSMNALDDDNINKHLNNLNNNAMNENSMEPSVDLTQMEYNVKQFLLKQNEWSDENASFLNRISSSSSTTVAEVKSNGFIHFNGREGSVDSLPTSSNGALSRTPHRTETNL